MAKEPKVFDRETLYGQVWAQPLVRIAEEYEVTGTELAKACDRLGVPRPPPGYWQKVAAGKAPPRPTLPPPEAGAVVSLPVHRAARSTTDLGHPDVSDEVRGFFERVAAVKRVRIPKKLSRPHRLLKESDALKGVWSRSGFRITASDKATARMRRTLQGIFDVLESFGCKLSAESHDARNGVVDVHIGETVVRFRLRELHKQVEVERPSWGGEERTGFDQIPTGAFEFEIQNWYRSGLRRRRWRETKGRSIASQLPEALLGLGHAAVARSIKGAEDDRAEAARREAAQERAAKRRLVEVEKELVRDLIARAEKLAELDKVQLLLNDTRLRELADRDGTWARWLEWGSTWAARAEAELVGDAAALPTDASAFFASR